MRSLAASLGDHPMAMLRGIAELRGVALTTNVREEAAAELTAALSAAGATGATVAQLSPAAQEAWAGLVSAGGQLKVPVFSRSHGTIRAIGPGKLEREATWREPAGPAEELWYRGLIFRAFADLGDGPLEYFYIPPELLPERVEALPTGRDPAIEVCPLATEPARVCRALNLLAVDACALLAAAAATPLRSGVASGTADPREEAARRWLLDPEPVRLTLLFTLAVEQGWMAPEHERLSLQGQSATEWLRQDAWEQTTLLFKAWQSSTGWNDLRRMPGVQAEGTWINDPRLARRALLRVLSELEPEAWYPVAGVVAHIKGAEPDFQRPDGNYNSWYLRVAGSERYLTGFGAWDEVEGRLLRFLLAGPLYWLGAVEVDNPEPATAEAFRLTAAGAYWIGRATLPQLYPPARVAVDEHFLAIAPLTTPLFDRFRLLRFTEPVAEPYEPGGPSKHRITRQSLARARTHGLAGAKIAQFLRRATGGQLPAKVEAALQRWDQHGGTVRISKGALLRVEDAAILASLRADPVIGPLIGELVSAQAALVREANLPRLLAALAELGYTAKVD